MKNLILITFLLSLIACGKVATTSNVKKGSKLPYQIANTEVAGTTTGGAIDSSADSSSESTASSSSSSDTTGGTDGSTDSSTDSSSESTASSSSSSSDTTGGTDGSTDSSTDSSSESTASSSSSSDTTGGTSGGEEEDEEVSTSTNFFCTFSNQNESKTAELDIQKNGNVKVAILIGEGQNGKFTFDGYTISPSGNENASVSHENEDELVEDGKIIKISARIVMNEAINEGELQVSYRIKNDNKTITETEFKKLADINNCSSN